MSQLSEGIMFKEDDDWNDEKEAQTLSETVPRNTQKSASSSTNDKSKAVHRKSLLRTLKTLGSVPEWKSDSHQQHSDSEAEEAPMHRRKKKKRRKKRKHAEKTEEQEGNEDTEQSLKDDKPVAKKRKKGAPKARSMTVEEAKEKESTEATKEDVNKPHNTERLSRQQWKNKMKNKRKCKNKFRQNNLEEEVNKAKLEPKQEPKEGFKTESYSNGNNCGGTAPGAQTKKKDKQHKPQKRKNSDDAGESQTKCNKDDRSGSKEKAGEPEEDIAHKLSAVSTKTPVWSKKEGLKRQKLLRLLHSEEPEQRQSPTEPRDEPPVKQEKPDRSSSLRSRMEQRLESARFRYINEILYTTSSGKAKRMFKQDPQAFWVYHRGYTAQVQRWPTNPVDAIISYIQRKPSSMVVADFGCGDCKIARSVKNKVHSFDLAAVCDLVTVCDMAHVPLSRDCVDIAVFCLSLMGTNLADFLAEANRVLKMGGILKIAEVASRFDNERNFVTALSSLGFKMASKDTENTHFYSFEFVKTKTAPEDVKKFGLQLKPCVYKKR
ncbi:uncharacterized protein rrp8 isoform 2-T2 [Pholidichthys leucotaenia]